MYQEKIFINSNDVDDHFELKISTIFKYLQQVSTNHSEILGVGKKDTVEKGMFWVITRMKVKILKMPTMLETLTVTTHPGETMSFIYPRHYEVYNEQGELCIVGNAIWVLLDLNTHQVKMKPFPDGFVIPAEKLPEDLGMPEKVIFDNLDKVETRRVRYSDIDLNAHLNNTKYIDYIIDIHDIDFYKKHRVKEILINFEKEIKNDDSVELFSDGNLPEIIVGNVDGVRSFSAKVSYENRDN